jgi:hypothetical protein
LVEFRLQENMKKRMLESDDRLDIGGKKRNMPGRWGKSS